jgi:ribosomal-protein-alanine N-acetyltransferase
MLQLNFNPFPVLYTQRLVLRPLNMDDAPALATLRSMEEMNRYIDRAPFISLEEARNQVTRLTNGIANGTNAYWVISLQNDSALIGTCCLFGFNKDKLSAEIGYELHPLQQGKGIAAEAVGAVIDYAVQRIGVKQLDAVIQPGNAKSIALIMRHGFKLNQSGAKQEGLNGFDMYSLMV